MSSVNGNGKRDAAMVSDQADVLSKVLADKKQRLAADNDIVARTQEARKAEKELAWARERHQALQFQLADAKANLDRLRTEVDGAAEGSHEVDLEKLRDSNAALNAEITKDEKRLKGLKQELTGLVERELQEMRIGYQSLLAKLAQELAEILSKKQSALSSDEVKAKLVAVQDCEDTLRVFESRLNALSTAKQAYDLYRSFRNAEALKDAYDHVMDCMRKGRADLGGDGGMGQ